MNARRTTEESSLAIAPCAGMMPLPNWGICHLSGALAPIELADELMRHVARGERRVLGKLLKRHIADRGELVGRAVARRAAVMIRVDRRQRGSKQSCAVLVGADAALLHQLLDFFDIVLGIFAALAVVAAGQQQVALA